MEPHTLTKSKVAAADKGGQLRRSVNLNMNVKDEGNDSDGKLGTFFNAVLDALQEFEYKEGVLNENYPADEASEPLADDKRMIIIETDKLLKMHYLH